MKHIIERLKEEVKQPTCKLLQKVCAYISIDDAQNIIDFYESAVKESGLTEDEFQNGGYTDAELNCKGCFGPCGQCKDEQPNAPDITPEWYKIPKGFDWVAVDKDGEEYAFTSEPFSLNACWIKGKNVFTGRKLNMAGIDWTKTLSERPK
jgi:hypothetical protein